MIDEFTDEEIWEQIGMVRKSIKRTVDMVYAKKGRNIDDIVEFMLDDTLYDHVSDVYIAGNIIVKDVLFIEVLLEDTCYKDMPILVGKPIKDCNVTVYFWKLVGKYHKKTQVWFKQAYMTIIDLWKTEQEWLNKLS